MTAGGLLTIVEEAFVYGFVLGFMFGMIFVAICWMWLDGREKKEENE